MSMADLRRSRAIVEQCEPRRLLSFTQVSNTIVTGAADIAVESASGNEQGRYALAWIDAGDVYVRAYNFDNTPRGVARQVTTDTLSSQADVAMDGTGSFVVTWQTDVAATSAVFVQRFSTTGAPLSTATQVDVPSGGNAIAPRVAVAGDQTFVVVWQSDSTGSPRAYRRAFDSSGAATGVEQLASNDATATNPDVQMNSDGEYVVVWNSSSATLAQRYSSAGSAQGGVITVASISGSQPAVGVAGSGSFVVAYSVDEAGPGTSRDIAARRYNSSGTALGSQFIVPSNTSGDEQAPQISVSNDGKFIIGWAEATIATPGQYNDVGFRAYVPDGKALSDDTFPIDDGAADEQFGPSNRFGILWPDAVNARVAVACTLDAAHVYEFRGQLTLQLDDDPHVLQLFGSGNNLRVVDNGVTTNYPTDVFEDISITGGDNADYIRAKNVIANMTVIGGDGNDTIITGSGDDSVEGGLGDDAINTGEGDDYAIGNADQDSMYGGSGSDTLTGGPGRNLMYGEDDNDLLTGGSRPDSMYGGDGDDRMRGGDGGDGLNGEFGNDDLRGELGNDGLDGGPGDDFLDGDGRVFGIGGGIGLLEDAGNDTLRGGTGNDTLLGRAGNDYLYGDQGLDLVDGGAGTDYGFTDNGDQFFAIEVRRLIARQPAGVFFP